MAASNLRVVTLRLFRLGVLCLAAWLVHLAARDERTSNHIALTVVRELFPDAASVSGPSGSRHGVSVFDADGRRLGTVLTTSPETDDLIGYAGPSNLLIALEPDGRVHGVSLLSSGDTAAHIDEVRRADSFWKSFAEWAPSSEPSRRIDAVSGSTLTSLAMAEAVERRLTGSTTSRRFPEPVTLDEVRALFATAARLQTNEPRPGWSRVLDDTGTTLGFVLRTSPASDNVRGYRGPTESLVAIAADERTVIGVRLRRSYDTPEYVDRVREDDDFLSLLGSRSIDEWARLDFAEAGIEGVSGATQTSFGVAEGLRRRFRAEIGARDVAAQTSRRTWHNAELLLIVLGALAIAYSSLRRFRFLRFVWQGVLIAGFGICLGDLVSLALLAGWSRNGVPWQTAPSLVLLTAVALLAPWSTRRNVYCQHLCPHGAAQEWLTSLRCWFKRTNPKRERGQALHAAEILESKSCEVPALAQASGYFFRHLTRWLARVPVMLLAVAWLTALIVPQFDLAQLEPFDAWVLPMVAIVSTIVFAVGLVASWFVPQAYCRFGCPTGALLKFVSSGGSYDRFGRRDVAAVMLLILGGALVGLRLSGPTEEQMDRAIVSRPSSASERPITELRGQAFGTTWSVKLRGDWPNSDSVRDRIASELSRIESTLSHWRPDSATAQFNATETTLPMEQPAELIALVARGQELSRVTGGLFDMTVAPLVQAWGYGPGKRRETPPTDAEIQELLQRTGWQKLEVDREANTLRKQHPALQLDLGALLQGHAVDHVAVQLASFAPQNSSEYLIEIGGELRARGAWQVAIENPSDASQPLVTLTLTNSALATSGIYRSVRSLNGEEAHHLISPQTGRPVTATIRLCSVRSATCLEADGWATALLLSDISAALRIAREYDLHVWLLDETGELYTLP